MIKVPGGIWLVEFNPQVGSEQAGVRPALVVSGTRFNANSPRVTLVMPLTSRDRGWPTHVRLEPDAKNGLTKPSWVLCEQIRAVAAERFRKHLGRVAEEVVEVSLHTLNEWIFEYQPSRGSGGP
jgi:mRNA interferase MazF